jgi:hypothetical protein
MACNLFMMLIDLLKLGPMARDSMLQVSKMVITSMVPTYLVLVLTGYTVRYYHTLIFRKRHTSVRQCRGTFVHLVSHLLQVHSLTPSIISEVRMKDTRDRGDRPAMESVVFLCLFGHDALYNFHLFISTMPVL